MHRLHSLGGLALLALALGCGQAESQPPAQASAGSEPAAAPAAEKKPGAPNGSPFSVTHVVEGTGPSPSPTDNVTVHYAGRLADGTEFDSSYARNAPATFPLDGVIKCWTQGVTQMKVGGKATLVCPPELAYGGNGAGPIPPNATLTFEVELLGIEPRP